MARLGDLIEQIRGVSYKPEDVYNELNENSVILLRANNIKNGQLDFDEIIYIDKKKVRENQILKAGDALLCTSSGSKELVGKAAYVQKDLPMTFGAFCKVVRPKKICSEYLGHFFNSPIYRWKISNSSAGASINNIRNEHIDELEIPLPEIEKQQYSASILDKLNNLISLRKQQLAKLDELVKARFVEMFGEPVSNPMQWDVLLLSNCLKSIENGRSFTCEAGPRKGEWPAILKLSAVTYGDYQWKENKAVLDMEDFVQSAEVRAGDLLFTRKNTPELVGMSAYVFETEPNLMMPDLIFRLNTNEKCDKIFLWQLINHELFRPSIVNLASGSAKSMSNISKERLSNLQIICPPMEVQRSFAKFVRRTYRQELTIQQSLYKLEVLKKSLMQEYFR